MIKIKVFIRMQINCVHYSINMDWAGKLKFEMVITRKH